MAQHTREWALNHESRLFPEKDLNHNTLTCIKNNQNWDINNLNEKLLERGFRMDRGYGQLRVQHLELLIWEIYIK